MGDYGVLCRYQQRYRQMIEQPSRHGIRYISLPSAIVGNIGPMTIELFTQHAIVGAAHSWLRRAEGGLANKTMCVDAAKAAARAGGWLSHREGSRVACTGSSAHRNLWRRMERHNVCHHAASEN